MSEIRLVVQSDDFGMCHSVNTGIVRAFTEGILTQASVMVPCPWFDEAAALALEHSIPTGVHCTFTAEWDHLRWRSLTGAASLRGEGATLPRSIKDARDSYDEFEFTAELVAQAERYLEAGLRLDYFDCHMGVVHREPYAAVCARFDRPFLYEIGDFAFAFTSRAQMSARETEDKLAWLVHHVESLEDGTHLVVTHCAEPSGELDSLARRDAFNYVWTQPYRVSDLACLTEPKVREVVERRGIRLVSVAEAMA